ncbi:HNH endonuclease [Streptomyces katsurahamanus]|uniref:HNH endonuclease n=2 Tax=Streptomyces katsurahamanus TaxID=2577098 RepID=A0ABW9P0V2_9ACTN|nr:HNH endonuclease [Streptomyces katsurahamanus]
MSWTGTEAALAGLLERHGERPRPDYPVAALCRAGLWSLSGHAGDAPSAHGDAKLRKWFAENRPDGGLAEPVYELLRSSGGTRLAVLDELLRAFDGLEDGALLEEVGLYDDELGDPVDLPAQPADPVDPDGPAERGGGSGRVAAVLVDAAEYERLCRMAERRRAGAGGGDAARRERVARDPIRIAAARTAVLGRSGGVCENPRCAGQPVDVTDRGHPILEVDHVMELALGGPDHPGQMVALCPNCHAVKTRGRTRETLRRELGEVAAARHAQWGGTPLAP